MYGKNIGRKDSVEIDDGQTKFDLKKYGKQIV